MEFPLFSDSGFSWCDMVTIEGTSLLFTDAKTTFHRLGALKNTAFISGSMDG